MMRGSLEGRQGLHTAGMGNNLVAQLRQGGGGQVH
jgi:hypothetical protein